MTETRYHITPEGRRLAVRAQPGQGTGLLFLGGFRSDMTGTKAAYLADWAAARGRPFVRFDYSGHGASDGAFEAGAIGDWFEDACAVLSQLTAGPQVLIGSSMGGWIALLLARAYPARIAGLVTVAAAPDFTEDNLWASFSSTEREALMREGKIERPSDYSDTPYVITRRLVAEGRARLVLRDPLDLPFPVRLLQGTADTDVPPVVALRLLDHAQGPDIRLTLVKGADHRFSTPACLSLIAAAIDEVAPA